jgi:hypothetical protein
VASVLADATNRLRVSCCIRDEEAAGSCPATPTEKFQLGAMIAKCGNHGIDRLLAIRWRDRTPDPRTPGPPDPRQQASASDARCLQTASPAVPDRYLLQVMTRLLQDVGYILRTDGVAAGCGDRPSPFVAARDVVDERRHHARVPA